MNSRSSTAIAFALLACGMRVLVAQSGSDLFQQALVKERTEGNLLAAIALYRTVIDQHGTDRPLVLKAMMQLGQCYEKLGKPEAAAVYERVIREFADQPESVALARTRLATLAPAGNPSRPAGRVVREVWSDAPDVPSAISRDGRLLAFSTLDNAVHVRDLSTSVNRKLILPPSPEDGRPNGRFAFSPDGRMVAYGWQPRPYAHPNLRVVALDGNTVRVPYRREGWNGMAPWDWSSDGKQILALALPALPANVRQTRRIVLVSVSDGAVQLVKTLPWDPNPLGMNLSPDGRFVVYDYPVDEALPQRDLFIVDNKTGQETRLVARAADDERPRFTPDGSGVVFFSRGAGTPSPTAWFVRVSGGMAQGSPELLNADLGANDSPLGFARNGSFYYRRSLVVEESVMANVDPVSGSIVGQPAAFTRRLITGGPIWSHDGKSIAYSSRKPSADGDLNVLVVRTVSSGEEVEVPTIFNRVNVRDWSPDNRFLLVNASVSSVPAEGNGLYRVNAQSGQSELLVRFPFQGGLDHPAWPANGNAIVFKRTDDSGRRIIAREVSTGHEVELYRAPSASAIGCLEVSADGRRLAFEVEDSTTRTTAIMTMTTVGTDLRAIGPRVSGLTGDVNILGVTPTGDAILFSTPNAANGTAKRQYWRIGVEGGELKEVQLVNGVVGEVSFNPGGRQMVFTMESAQTAVMAMENFLPPARGAR